VRPHLPRLALAFAILAALTCACGPTGPDTRSGISACDQLRECACDPSRTFDPDTCNATVDLLEADVDAQRLCSQRLTLFGCGRGLQVNPPGF